MLIKMFKFYLRAKSDYNEILKKFNLTFGQWQVLKVVNSSPNKELLIVEIVKQLSSDKATISIIVKRLYEEGMIEIRKDSKDKRKKYITVSSSMKKKFTQLQKLEKEFINDLFSALTEEEVEQLTKIMNKLEKE